MKLSITAMANKLAVSLLMNYEGNTAVELLEDADSSSLKTLARNQDCRDQLASHEDEIPPREPEDEEKVADNQLQSITIVRPKVPKIMRPRPPNTGLVSKSSKWLISLTCILESIYTQRLYAGFSMSKLVWLHIARTWYHWGSARRMKIMPIQYE